MRGLPKISVVTPSFNQGGFIEQTILSVLGQQYPRLEYIVMDGGSTDDSVEVIERYASQLTHWRSRPDKGQANAINEGMAMATGDILCWLNSDDILLPGALHRVAAVLKDVEGPALLFGDCLHMENGKRKCRGSEVARDHGRCHIELLSYVIQPSSFFNRRAWEATGALDEELHYSFDWDWQIRAARKGVSFMPLKEYLSVYRIHSAHKSATGGCERMKEISMVAARYNDERRAASFARWMRLQSALPWIGPPLQTASRLDISALNAIARLLLFPRLTRREYGSMVRMN